MFPLSNLFFNTVTGRFRAVCPGHHEDHGVRSEASVANSFWTALHPSHPCLRLCLPEGSALCAGAGECAEDKNLGSRKSHHSEMKKSRANAGRNVLWTTLYPGDAIYIPPHYVVVSKVVHSNATFIRVQSGTVTSQSVAKATCLHT